MAVNYIAAKEVSTALGISMGKSYEIIRSLNKELAAKGFITIAGRCPRKYFSEKYYGFEPVTKEVG